MGYEFFLCGEGKSLCLGMCQRCLYMEARWAIVCSFKGGTWIVLEMAELWDIRQGVVHSECGTSQRERSILE